jgi:type III secretion protein HrpB1
MNPKLDRKAFVACLIDLVQIATERAFFDDAISVLSGARTLRPKVVELDWFEGRIAFKRKQYRECIQVLRNLEASKTHGYLAKAMIAACQFYLGDQDWQAGANEVLQGDAPADAVAIVRTLPGMGSTEEKPTEEATPYLSSLPELFQSGFMHFRA